MPRTIETHSSHNPRLLLFYAVVAVLAAVLTGGLAYRQLFRSGHYSARERKQSQRRIVVPGPRGEILDRNGKVLVGNSPKFSVVLNIAELRDELADEYRIVRRNYRNADPEERPTSEQQLSIARQSVVQRYMDQVNHILGRAETVRTKDLQRHFDSTRLLPFTLLDNLEAEEYAKLIERLPVESALQVFASSRRYYPNGASAAHVLGYTGIENAETDNDDEELMTFKMKGIFGREGLEKKYDATLQGKAGEAVILVDNTGYKVPGKPLEKRLPVQGKNLITSLDAELQKTAEDAIGDERKGAAVAIDVRTGEVLALVSKPDYDLNKFVPRLSTETFKEIEEQGGWTNQAISGAYPPGSTFKILVSIAALRRGAITPDQPIADCQGSVMIGGHRFVCENGEGHHGPILLPEAIARSCDIYFYEAGRRTTAQEIAEEGRRFHLDKPSGIELPGETSRMVIPEPEWKARMGRTPDDKRWYPGDTANMSIGQGYVLVTPLDMACFAASVARNETYTKPTLLHEPNRPPQHTEPIGLTPSQRAALLKGMEECTIYGTANIITSPAMKIPGVRIAGKTGTAQVRVRQGEKIGTINCAWFICFAPVENPEIAIAVMLEGETLGETYGGGFNAAPVANVIIKKYLEQKAAAATPADQKFKVSIK